VSLEELEADMKSKMQETSTQMAAAASSGVDRFSDSDTFQQLMDMSSSGSEEDGIEAYGQMQEAFAADYGSESSLTSGLSLTA
jgi:hypothetical protein